MHSGTTSMPSRCSSKLIDSNDHEDDPSGRLGYDQAIVVVGEVVKSANFNKNYNCELKSHLNLTGVITSRLSH